MSLFLVPRGVRSRLLFLPILGLLAGAAAAPVAAQATFVRVGDLTVGRNGATATLLADGRVLVMGGTRTAASGSGSVFNKEAEIYDPNTTAFTATGSMSVARFFGTSVRLNDGRVLVLGGQPDGSSTTDTAEIFDPTKGTFTPTENMPLSREGASATVLQDGTPLVVGGLTIDDSGTGVYNEAELYDPTAGTFSQGTTLEYHDAPWNAVTVPDGRVLLFGSLDLDAGNPTGDVEAFDPATGSFSIIGKLNVAREAPVATLLADGTVAVSGGYTVAADGSTVTLSDAIEVFDPVTAKVTVTGTTSVARRNHVAVGLADGRLLIAGGTVGPSFGNASTDSVDLFDPKTGKTTPLAPLTEPRSQAAAVRLQDGSVLIMGGVQIANGATQARLFTAVLFKP